MDVLVVETIALSINHQGSEKGITSATSPEVVLTETRDDRHGIRGTDQFKAKGEHIAR